jgi:hypothetical protein
MGNGFPRRLANAVRELANVLNANTEPRDAVAARDADQAEDQNHGDGRQRVTMHEGARRVDRGREAAEVQTRPPRR